MSRQIWLLVLVTSLGFGCAQDDTQEVERAAAPTPTSYILEVTFEGLVGYVNVADGVWALLPKADPAVALPPGAPNNPNNYPPHYAVLHLSGKNVRNFALPVDVQIPIDGFDLVLPQSVFGSGGSGLPPAPFRQNPSDAAVDKLATGVLDSPPAVRLAARMKLPRTDLRALESTNFFQRVVPLPPQNGICREPLIVPVDSPRVERVTWSPSLSTELELTFRPFGGADTTLVLGPAPNENTVKLKILNQVAGALHNPNHPDSHWPAYRWFYNLSNNKDCARHYYPQGVAGGNRCPQKLYSL